ncbi:MAG: hypothetical protein IT181_26385, partial [Acidobacteria bacterium]|nr:hypothetical protein [Acidobacteriota bacterium]
MPPRFPRTRRSRAAIVLAAMATATALLAGCGGTPPAPAPASTGIDPATTGTITGTVRLEGTPPDAQMIRMDGDKRCASLVPGATRATESYVVGPAGTLANVFVYVKTGLEGRSFPVPDAPVVLDQQ